MQSPLIQRYLGNKSSMCSNIVNVIREIAHPGDLVFDAFSGSLAVSSALRAAGYEVASNDINHFSWTYARAYFSSQQLPWPDPGLVKRISCKEQAWQRLADELTAPYTRSLPATARRSDIFEHYCEDGGKSGFVSSRGAIGRRRFFTADNAHAIDRALSRIRHWHRASLLDEQTRCLLTATLLNAVEKVSNTQGTYHDFPRDQYDARSLKPMRLVAPRDSYFGGPVSRVFGKAQDSLTFARSVPTHKVLYLDPPYNFRQYTSYYFMLNLLSTYAEIDDLDGYFSDIEFVRGQNMANDFKSTFCSKREFIPSLERLVREARCQYVVLSYFDGRNHWGKFKESASEQAGRHHIERLFSGELFVPRSLRCFPVSRLNYQSYGGYSAKAIQEFIFVAEKASTVPTTYVEGNGTWTGQLLA